jgi:putative phosphoserine phosphatase/1-acylglycerol-3-phosphate O-acyltransferase
MQEKVINIYKVLVAFVLIIFMGVIGSFIRIVSLGYLTNFNRKYVLPFFSKITLWLVGIQVEDRLKLELPEQPHFITFNHNSYLDGFVLVAHVFTNTRFLLSTSLIKKLPIAFLPSFAIGVKFIPTKENREKRLEFFKRLEKLIVKEKVHIVGSSEGVHDFIHGIGEFNRGVYHMALNCKMPVVAIYINTPYASNPFNKFKPFKRGTIRMELIKVVETDHWTLSELDTHVEEVRQLFVDRFEEYQKGNLA